MWHNEPFPYKKAVVFVDNAGADVVLGILPLVREMLRKGVQVVLAANETPSINDITAEELSEVVAVCGDDVIAEAFDADMLKVMSSGNSMPVIDLQQLAYPLAVELADADLVVLEGMGRAIETNLHVRLTCDVLKLGMVKHPEVAQVRADMSPSEPTHQLRML